MFGGRVDGVVGQVGLMCVMVEGEKKVSIPGRDLTLARISYWYVARSGSNVHNPLKKVVVVT